VSEKDLWWRKKDQRDPSFLPENWNPWDATGIHVMVSDPIQQDCVCEQLWAIREGLA
jgi:hypothetical protein